MKEMPELKNNLSRESKVCQQSCEAVISTKTIPDGIAERQIVALYRT